MKGRKAQNQITILIREDGTIIMDQEAITTEAMDFYKNLFGKIKSYMPTINQEVLKRGPVLQQVQQLALIRDFNKEDVLATLKSIDDNKAPMGDGFNAYFYKKTRHVIGDEVTKVILNFLNTNDMYERIIVTLIPKVKHPSSIKEYRPISCCTVFV